MEKKKRLKILIISQYFWPENFRVNDIVRFFRDSDVEIEVLTGKPNYPVGYLFKEYAEKPSDYKNYHGAKITRVPIITRKKGTNFDLFINYSSFFISSIIFGLFAFRKKKFDYIFTFGTSPLTVAITSIILSKVCKSKTCLWVLDLWPEIIFELGILKKNRIMQNILSGIITFIFKKTDIIFAQSKSYLDLIKKKIENKNKVYYFPSWPEESLDKPIENISVNNRILLNDKFKEKFKIFFTGSIGDAQNFSKVSEIISKTKNLNLTWFIIGGGRRFGELIKLKNNKKLDNLELIDFIDPSKIKEYQNQADVFFLSLKKGPVLSSTIPGKFSTYLKFKKPILGLISGEVNSYIKKYKVGFAVDPDDSELLIEKIKLMMEYKKNSLLSEKFTGHEILLKEFDYKTNLENFRNILELNRKKNNIKLIKLVKKLDENFFKKNFVLSGLNLSFLGHYIKKETKIFKDLYHWPDGLFKLIFFKGSIKKIPGRELVNSLKIPSFVNKIHVIGDLSSRNKNYLIKRFNKKILHTSLPYAEINELKQIVPRIDNDSICFITLPTPKQEQLAEFISEKQTNFRIFCIGGAINMNSGEEKPCPKFMEDYGMETFWRLRTDTRRRSIRLIKTLYWFSKGLLFRKFKNLNGIIEK
tara:strand:+ start:3505 stop:5430 length:1926 start_codon:yes stop_codon:yes gene_type:complete